MNGAANKETTMNKAGFRTMARVLEKELIAAEDRAYRTEKKADLARVEAIRQELARVERGEL